MSFLSESYDFTKAEEIYDRHEGDCNFVQKNGVNYRVDFKDTPEGQVEVSLIRGRHDHIEPNYYIHHDYAPAFEAVRQYQNYLSEGLIRIPRPFEPIAKQVSQGTDNLYDLIYQLCVTFDGHYVSGHFDKYLKRKNRVVPSGPLLIQMVGATQVNEGVLGLVFNPFSTYAASMLREIRFNDGIVYGVYDFEGKAYNFKWKVEHRHYVVNSDIWSQVLHAKDPQLLCFSLVSLDNIYGSAFDLVKEPRCPYPVPPLVVKGVEGFFDVGLDEGTALRVPGVTVTLNAEEGLFLNVEFDGKCDLVNSHDGDIYDVADFVGTSFCFKSKLRSTYKDEKVVYSYCYKEAPGETYNRYVFGDHYLYVHSMSKENLIYMGSGGVEVRVNGKALPGRQACVPSLYFGEFIETVTSSIESVFSVLMEMSAQEKFEWFLRTYWPKRATFSMADVVF